MKNFNFWVFWHFLSFFGTNDNNMTFLDAKVINLKYDWKGASKNYVISIISIISYNVIFESVYEKLWT